MGLPIDAIKHAMRLDGENPRRLMGPLKVHLFSKFGRAPKVHETPLREDPKYYKASSFLAAPMDVVAKQPNLHPVLQNAPVWLACGGGEACIAA